MVEQIYAVFEPVISGDRINLQDGSSVAVSLFAQIFEGCELTYNCLAERDGGEKGYMPFFEYCKENGILN